MFDPSKILNALRKGVDFVETIAPIATVIGGPIVGMVIGAISAVSDIAENANKLANEGKVVFSGGETAEIQAILGRIAKANDALNKAIENS